MAAITREAIHSHVESIALKATALLALELIEVKVIYSSGHDIALQVLADRPDGRITMDECAALNGAIALSVEEAGVLPGEAWSLEVSSPGLDRPLVTSNDFKRNMNALVHVYLTEVINGKSQWEGNIAGVDEGKVTLTLKKNQQVIIPLSVINKGALIF